MFRTIRSIIAQRQQSEALRDLAWSYSELAGAKLLAIRAGIERNRTYVSEMATVFHIIRLAAEKQKLKMPAKKKGTVSLLLTSNHRFYGGLESRLTQFFLARTSISYGELFVVGRSGEIYVKGLVARPEFRSFIFDDDLPTARELQDLADQIEPYSRVFVYYSKLATVLLQRPVVVELGGLVDIPIVADPRSNYYIFEPELTEMVTSPRECEFRIEEDSKRDLPGKPSRRQQQNVGDGRSILSPPSGLWEGTCLRVSCGAFRDKLGRWKWLPVRPKCWICWGVEKIRQFCSK